MKDIVDTYIQSVSKKFSHESTSEYGYRTDFELLLKGIFETIKVTRFDNDPKAKGGNKPDFVIIKDDVPLLYIETKDIGVLLDKIEKSEQMSRYYGYANLILTDYLEFRFYRNGEPYGKPIVIAEYDIKTRTLSPKSDNYEYLAKTILDFTKSHKEPIKSGEHLAKIMGGKGQRIRDNIKDIFSSNSNNNIELKDVYETIKRLLINDLTADSFADMYAQTLVYGLFIARFYDESLGSFSRQEARDLIPASNPFLGHFFDHIAGRNFEKRLSYIVDELCEVFTHANVAELMERHFKVSSKKGTQRGQDQVIHFYEDFLKEYDDKLRKKMGAYYTPLPVVQFIVRSVDYLLEKEFGLSGGLANTSKTENGLHKVQILDPAVGTGTFISDVIGKIYTRIKKAGQKGRWPAYVHHDLLPRLFGFELMMAPYTIAHLKLSMALKETGFLYFNETRKGKARLGIYLNNSLEEVNKQPELLAFDFGASIAEEAKQASKIKNEKPIMVVLGNPPYSVSSSNKGQWIQDLIQVYKDNLNERNIQPLSDDYIKFIRFAEHFIEKNGSGIVAMITNNSFIDGTIHRQMRKHLLETFNDIYILDLHGNSKKKETAPDGGKDENVFNIQQGVSINILIRKKGEKKDLGEVHHADLYGKRTHKFNKLDDNRINTIEWQTLDYKDPYYFFVPKDFESESEYLEGFRINELFQLSNAGTATGKDSVFVKMNKEELINSLRSSNIDYDEKHIANYLYRPFDTRKIIYDNNLIQRLRTNIMDNMLSNNVALLTCKKQTSFDFQHIFISNSVTDRCSVSLQTGEVGYVFPLYLYHEDKTKTSNLKKEIVTKIEKAVGKTTPEDIFDYIYAVLHSPKYREKYKEFLKIDFPRVPYPKDKNTFKKLVKFGRELRELHLLESLKVNKFITTYPVTGSDTVEKPEYKDGKVYINDEQYFGNVPEDAWNFWIGGYQPAQKWLKDRKNKTLTNEDIEHYQKMIVSLNETYKIMKAIDQ
ncbi:N-6 DNA methylase [Candidatus Woesebacteria bacterium]|nr:N-6 DNA methylase [Candidatus Woesebacteria bacterium]